MSRNPSHLNGCDTHMQRSVSFYTFLLFRKIIKHASCIFFTTFSHFSLQGQSCNHEFCDTCAILKLAKFLQHLNFHVKMLCQKSKALKCSSSVLQVSRSFRTRARCPKRCTEQIRRIDTIILKVFLMASQLLRTLRRCVYASLYQKTSLLC